MRPKEKLPVPVLALVAAIVLATIGQSDGKALGRAPGWSAFHQKPICKPPPRWSEAERTFSFSSQLSHKLGNLTAVVFLQSSDFTSLQMAARVEKLAKTLQRGQQSTTVDFQIVNSNNWHSRASTFALKWATTLPVTQSTYSADIYADFGAAVQDVLLLDKCGYLVYKISMTELSDVERKVQPAITRMLETSPCRHCYSSAS